MCSKIITSSALQRSQNNDIYTMNESFEVMEEEFLASYDNFDAMSLHENLLKGIYAYGLEKPSTIQQRGIVPISRGLDVILQAQPGSGKTTCLCIGILQQINYSLTQCQAVVVAPTRELAHRTATLLEALGGVRVCVCAGGITAERRGLAGGAHVVVGTPGRVFGLIHRHDVRVDCIRTFVLDGADEILSRGFTDQIHEILEKLASEVEVGVVLVLATMPPADVLEIIRKFIKKPVKILETN